MGFWWFHGGIEINQFASIHLILEAKFGEISKFL